MVCDSWKVAARLRGGHLGLVPLRVSAPPSPGLASFSGAK